MMRRHSLTARRVILVIASALIAALGVAGSATALVVNDTNSDGTQAGVSLVPSARGDSLPGGVSSVTASGSCTDPWLSSDLGGPTLPSYGICYRGGPVMHKNETFALTWDAPYPDGTQRHYWSLTRGYVEQYLRDVADSSGSLSSPYAVTTQYQDSGGRAQNASVFGGGCIDYGVVGNSACEYGNPTGAGHDYPAMNASHDCTVSGASFVDGEYLNTVCLTDAQIQDEISTMVSQTGIVGRTQPGYTPLVTLLLPPGVDDCLDSDAALCSANSVQTPPQPVLLQTSTGGTVGAGTYQVEITYDMNSGQTPPSTWQTITTTGSTSTITVQAPPTVSGENGWYAYIEDSTGAYRLQGSENNPGVDYHLTAAPTTSGAIPPTEMAFCSYHSQVNVNGTEVSYVVQPWTAGTPCDEPDAPTIAPNPPFDVLERDIGTRLVSPLSQSEMAAITDPSLNGWVSHGGGEIEDALGCAPAGNGLDTTTLGSSSQNPYYIQREGNNAGVLEFDPATYFGCAPVVNLEPQFVAPSAVDQGDEVQLDGSATASTLIVPNQGYSWNFGDGTTATGPSVVHTFSKAGSYQVTLTTTDRGGNTNTLTETIQVLGATGQPAGPAPTTAAPGSGGSSSTALNVHLQLMPQSLKGVLRSGIAVRVTSNQPANGIATVSITRAAAKRAHLKVGKGPSVRIGIGTIASVKNGTIILRLHLSKRIVKKLAHVGHLNLMVRLGLVAPNNQQLAIDAAGRY